MEKIRDYLEKYRIFVEIINLLVGGVLIAALTIQGNRLIVQQNNIAKIQYSPALKVELVIHDNSNENICRPEVFISNYNFPISEFIGEGQCILVIKSVGNEERYILNGIFKRCEYPADTSESKLIIRSYNPDINFDSEDFLEYYEKIEGVESAEIEYYYKLTYKDAFDKKNVRYYNLTNGSEEILDKTKGRNIFESNMELEGIEYDKIAYEYEHPNVKIRQ